MTDTDAPIRVVVVDDDPMVVTGIKGILAAAAGIDVVGSALSGEESLEQVALHFPDVVLMDIRMPGIGGIEAIERLVNGVRPPTVVALTSFDSDDYLFRALEAGAAGYLLKDIGPADLAEAIRTVHRGEPILSPHSLRQVLNTVVANRDQQLQRDAVELLAELTDRELEIAARVAEGLSNQEIAEATFMSPATVKTHPNRINAKLDTSNRVHIAVMVERSRTEAPAAAAHCASSAALRLAACRSQPATASPAASASLSARPSASPAVTVTAMKSPPARFTRSAMNALIVGNCATASVSACAPTRAPLAARMGSGCWMSTNRREPPSRLLSSMTACAVVPEPAKKSSTIALLRSSSEV